MHKRGLTLLFMIAVVLSACGGTSSTTTRTSPSLTSTQIVAGLKAKGMPIGETIDFTASTDQNHFLGRPGQYTSKSSWIDTSIASPSDHTGVDISVSDGGSVEVCANVSDAQARFTYLQAVEKAFPMFTEYDYLRGTAILRISNGLIPDQAKAYDTAFKSIVS